MMGWSGLVRWISGHLGFAKKQVVRRQETVDRSVETDITATVRGWRAPSGRLALKPSSGRSA